MPMDFLVLSLHIMPLTRMIENGALNDFFYEIFVAIGGQNLSVFD